MTAEQEGAYVAFRPCGCPVMAITADCRDASREVARAIKKGERIERMTIEAVRALHWTGCEQCKPQSVAKQTALL